VLVRSCIYRFYRHFCVGDFDGIRFASISHDATEFVNAMRSSLSLIRTHDPRRYRRVKDHICWIVDAARHDGAGGIAYNSYLRQCTVDFSDFGWDSANYLAAYYAHLIVHEATHGWLCARGFRYTRSSRMQHERICVAEENRFLKRLDRHIPGVYETWASEFDPRDWDVSWTFWRRKKQEVRRILERLATEQSDEPEPE
jgi:hypothetical protein